MASIERQNGAVWRVRVRIPGDRWVTKTFALKRDAERWAALMERRATGRGPSTTAKAHRLLRAILTLGDPDWWDHEDEARFVCDPLIPEGRHVSIVAEAKAGKSLLGLYVAAGLASGRGALNTPAGEPVRVVYVDMEMTQADARERLRSMGYGPGDDLDALAYYSMPDLGGLDTASGGGDLVELARHHDAALVVIDTMVASLAGAENDAETIREFGRHTIAALKRDGRAVVRLDRLGKDTTRGARWSSAKAGDVDVEWTLTAQAGGVQLKATRRRIPWVPEVVELTRDDYPLAYRRVPPSAPSTLIGWG